MKRIMNTIVCLSLATLCLSSCVSKRKYVSARARATQEYNDNQLLNARITRLEDSISQMHGRLGAMGNANENANDQLNRTNNELNMTKEQVMAQRARLQQMESFLAQQQKAVQALKDKITAALTGFNSNDLTIEMKNGKVYINLQEGLLFPSGSAVVNARGKDALAKVAGVLNTNTDLSIDIEGHTDNKPIHSKEYPDNWSPSTARATSIAHVLIDEYAVQPAKLVASGRSKYDPVASNDSPEGRAQNRRTEIILEPQLDELMQLMNAPATTAGK